MCYRPVPLRCGIVPPHSPFPRTLSLGTGAGRGLTPHCTTVQGLSQPLGHQRRQVANFDADLLAQRRVILRALEVDLAFDAGGDQHLGAGSLGLFQSLDLDILADLAARRPAAGAAAQARVARPLHLHQVKPQAGQCRSRRVIDPQMAAQAARILIGDTPTLLGDVMFH